MIEATNLTRIFSNGHSEVRAVDNVHLEVNRGEFSMILGRSGSGKSTLLGMLAGLIRPTSGTVRIKGTDISSLSDDLISELRAREIGFIFQFSGLLPTLTVLDNLMLPALFYPGKTDVRTRALGLLDRVGLSDRANAYPGTLSSGEMKRVAIARALSNGPALLIADEPTGDLDVDTEYEIMELFRQLNVEGMTIVMVTHNPDLVRYATRIYGMEKGRLAEGFHSVHTGHGPMEPLR
ncbi:MAG TPA: ABC transporter ATP-binding protein [Methanoregulaceae archaeon]|nr:ABC transporter ATP-binding protein [Methanoregulaceae archaeon]HQA80209.1 ABC transporter ATP-binding protein [Methanoregulaceae archaeon]